VAGWSVLSSDMVLTVIALDSLLGVNFDLKPLNSNMDKRIKVQLEPVQIVYDAVSQRACICASALPSIAPSFYGNRTFGWTAP
jgi:hypothetical protein